MLSSWKLNRSFCRVCGSAGAHTLSSDSKPVSRLGTNTSVIVVTREFVGAKLLDAEILGLRVSEKEFHD